MGGVIPRFIGVIALLTVIKLRIIEPKRGETKSREGY